MITQPQGGPLCDQCNHKNVCKHKEEYTRITDHIYGKWGLPGGINMEISPNFVIDVKCTYVSYMSKPSVYRSAPTDGLPSTGSSAITPSLK